jgi:hypothetical protein
VCIGERSSERDVAVGGVCHEQGWFVFLSQELDQPQQVLDVL